MTLSAYSITPLTGKLCPTTISKSIIKVVENIHPPRNTEEIREKLLALGKEFEEKTASVVRKHIEDQASTIRRQVGYLSADHKQTLYTELDEVTRQPQSRISSRTLGHALGKLGTRLQG